MPRTGSSRSADGLLHATDRELAVAHLPPRDRYRKLAAEAHKDSKTGEERNALLKLVFLLAASSDESDLREGLTASRRVLALDTRLNVSPFQTALDHNGHGRLALELALRVVDGKEHASLLAEALQSPREYQIIQ